MSEPLVMQILLKKDRKKSSNFHPSDLSRNYSGSSAYYTPVSLSSTIIKGIHFFLKTHFGKKEGVTDKSLYFVDPAAGMNAFPIQLLKYVQQNLKIDNFEDWKQKVFLKQLYMMEIDRGIKSSAMKKINIHLHSEFPQSHYKISNPLSDPQKSEFLFKSSNNPLIIFGNPPYSVSSTSKSDWIQSLVEDYKKELNRSGKKRIVGLKGIQDDYVKFIRWAQWVLTAKDGGGILAFVVNNFFLDGIIFRGMRHSLRTAFNVIYVINLHGDPKKRYSSKGELSDNEKDVNFFPIQTGICLFFAIRFPNSAHSDNLPKAQVYYCDIRGSLQTKEKFLMNLFSITDFSSTSYSDSILKHFTLVPNRTDFEFIPLSSELQELESEYNQFFYLPDIFQDHIIGAQSLHDSLITNPDRARLELIISNFYTGQYDKHEVIDSKKQRWVKYNGVNYHDARDWTIEFARQGSFEHARQHIFQWQWRGLDRWWVCYDPYLMTRGSSSFRLMQYLLPHNLPDQQNIAIGVSRVSRKAKGDNSIFITNTIAESHFIEGGSGIGDYVFPLKINEDSGRSKKNRDWNNPLIANTYNFDPEFLKKIMGFYFSHFSNQNSAMDQLAEQIFYYIYGILWTPAYRSKFQPFLKQEFPRIPFPQGFSSFYPIFTQGKSLADLHLFQGSYFQNLIDSWNFSEDPQHADLHIRKPFYEPSTNRIYFNGDQSAASFWIGDISPEMWQFEIGNQPQLRLWLRNHTFIPQGDDLTKVKKYAFSRPVNIRELNIFLKICIVAQKTPEIQTKLNNIYIDKITSSKMIEK
ncbi:MAG: type ISP restriction/modification enzyme [Promethearchaeota archaeon]